MSALQSLESSLDELFVKKGPALPAGGKKAIVKYLPWVSLIIGILTLLSAFWLWQWAHTANDLINAVNSYNAYLQASGVPTGSTSHLTLNIWLGLIVLTIEGLLYFSAYFGTRDRKKSGWNLLFYGLLLNLVYGVIMAFSSYNGGFSNLLGALIGFAIGGWLLFQIRASYLGKAPADSKPAAAKKA